jgi:hypothetical protein
MASPAPSGPNSNFRITPSGAAALYGSPLHGANSRTSSTWQVVAEQMVGQHGGLLDHLLVRDDPVHLPAEPTPDDLSQLFGADRPLLLADEDSGCSPQHPTMRIGISAGQLGDVPPPRQRLEHLGQIEGLGRPRHGPTPLAIELPDFLRQQGLTDLARTGGGWNSPRVGCWQSGHAQDGSGFRHRAREKWQGAPGLTGTTEQARCEGLTLATATRRSARPAGRPSAVDHEARMPRSETWAFGCGGAGNRTRVLRRFTRASPCAVRYASTRIHRSREQAGVTIPVAV